MNLAFWILFLCLKLVHGTYDAVGSQCSLEDSILFYVDRQNEFFRLELKENGALLPIKHGSTGIRRVKHLIAGNFRAPDSFYLSYLDDRYPRRFTYLSKSMITWNTRLLKFSHSDVPELIKEIATCYWCQRKYLITLDNQIKICCNRKMVLFRAPPDTQIRNLILNPRLGQMFWIEEGGKCTIKVAGMDGRKVRGVATFDQIYSLAFDNVDQMLYSATPNGIFLLSVNDPNPVLYLNVVASRLKFYKCTLFYIETQTGFINSYRLQRGIKRLVHVEDPGALFDVSGMDENSEKNPCVNETCTEYCVHAEGPDQAIGRCLCPDCTEDTEENGEVLDFVEVNEANWLARVLFVLLVFMTIVLFVEIKFGWISVWTRQIGQKVKLERIRSVMIFRKNSSFNES